MAIGLGSALSDVVDTIGMVGSLADPRQGPTVVEFFDFFFSDNLGRPANNFNTFVQWNVTGGSVDLVGGVGPGVFGAPPDQPLGRYVDLGGSTKDPGLFETRLAYPVIAGQTYNFSFDYRSTGGDLNRATAFVGDREYAVTSDNTNFDRFSTTFTATESGVVKIAFQGDETDRDGSGVGIDGVQFGQVLGPDDGDFSGSANPDAFFGSARGDDISGGDGNDILSGAGGNDRVNGDAGADILLGQTGNDILDGGRDQDVMAGGIGNDIYYIDNSGDLVFEQANQGTDRSRSSIDYTLTANVETLELIGSGAIDGTGNEQINLIAGNVAANVIDGKIGNDVLKGGSGIDSFVFSTALGTGNVDRITDFSVGKETIRLDHSVFSALEVGALDASQFASVTAGEKYGADDQIIYREDKGALYYDPDGYGGAAKAVAFAVLDTHPINLSAGDFLIV